MLAALSAAVGVVQTIAAQVFAMVYSVPPEVHAVATAVPEYPVRHAVPAGLKAKVGT